MIFLRTIMLLFAFFISIVEVRSYTCRCGSYSSGVYYYNTIGTSGDCCTGATSSTIGGIYITYTEQYDGVWAQTGGYALSGQDAQSACCI